MTGARDHCVVGNDFSVFIALQARTLPRNMGLRNMGTRA